MTTSEANRDKNERLNDFEESVACQLCDQSFPVANLRWHILKEHCHDKISECSICEKKFGGLPARPVDPRDLLAEISWLHQGVAKMFLSWWTVQNDRRNKS